MDVVAVGERSFFGDYDELLASSLFHLVPRGEGKPSAYRFVEAVCSNGIPVLLSDNWVPPFNEVVDFSTYGLQIAEKDVPKLQAILKAIPTDRRGEPRLNAARACRDHFQTLPTQIGTMLQGLAKLHSRDAEASLGRREAMKAEDERGHLADRVLEDLKKQTPPVRGEEEPSAEPEGGSPELCGGPYPPCGGLSGKDVRRRA